MNNINLSAGEIKRAESFIRKVTGNKKAVITAWSSGRLDEYNRREYRLEVCEGYDGYPQENWENFYIMSDEDDRRRSYTYYLSKKMFYGKQTSKAKKQVLV